SSAYLFSDFQFIGPGYAYDKTKTYKHYWVMDLANAEGETKTFWRPLIPQIAAQFPVTSLPTPKVQGTTAMKAFTSILALAVVALVGSTNAIEAESVSRELQVADYSTKMLNAVNAKRAEKGLAAVCINTKLMKAAQVLAEDNANSNRISTVGSDGSTQADRLEAQNITATSAAELVGAGYVSVDRIIAAWMKASSEYIYADYPYIGPGYKYDKTKQYKHYWVLDLSDGEGETCA
ncbi:hypothetical protein BBO99_00007256, partial [Phytophthora kernoviae]